MLIHYEGLTFDFVRTDFDDGHMLEVWMGGKAPANWQHGDRKGVLIGIVARVNGYWRATRDRGDPNEMRWTYGLANRRQAIMWLVALREGELHPAIKEVETCPTWKMPHPKCITQNHAHRGHRMLDVDGEWLFCPGLGLVK